MGFLGERYKAFKLQRKKDAAFNKILNEKKDAVRKQERLKQELRITREAEKVRADERLKSYKSSYDNSGGSMPSVGDLFGGYVEREPRQRTRTYKTTRKGSKKMKSRKRYNSSRERGPERFDVVGGGYNII